MTAEIATIVQIALTLIAAAWLGLDRLAGQWLPRLVEVTAAVMVGAWRVIGWLARALRWAWEWLCYVYAAWRESDGIAGIPDIEEEYQPNTESDTTRTDVIKRAVAMGMSANQIVALVGGNRNAVLAEVRAIKAGDAPQPPRMLRIRDASGVRVIPFEGDEGLDFVNGKLED